MAIKKGRLRGARRIQPGNDPNIGSRGEARLKPLSLKVEPEYWQFLPGQVGPGGISNQALQAAQLWTAFLTPQNIQWVYNEQSQEFASGTATTQTVTHISVPERTGFVLLEWTPLALIEDYRGYTGSRFPLDPMALYPSVGAEVRFSGASPLQSVGTFSDGTNSVTVAGSLIFNTVGFVGNPNHPMPLYAGEGSTVNSVVTIRGGGDASFPIEDADELPGGSGLSVGGRILGFYASVDALDRAKGKLF